ncbi:MAG: hypothetical protein IPI58_01155 [Alphaproteobacteria bacterium]|nr:MAG: hypothetical protein IPI58_01155 [Alphaproteobacteria bacterium]
MCAETAPPPALWVLVPQSGLESGIAIGPILWVVAIIAVLAAAVSAGSDSFNGDTSIVKAKAQATAILAQANAVKLGVDRVLGRGCSNMEISFENPIVSGYANGNAPSDKSCHVFDINGGGISWVAPPANTSGYAEGYFYTANYNLTGKEPEGGGNQPNQDLVMFLINIPANVCAEINRILSSNSSIPTTASYWNNMTSFVGTRKFGQNFYWVGYGGSSGHPSSGCLLSPTVEYGPNLAGAYTETNQYIFYNVLISN